MIGSIGRTDATAGAARATAGGGGGGAEFGGLFAKAEETEAQRIDRLRTAIHDLGREAEMTPAERIRRDVLEKLGLTEDSLIDLPPDRREHVERQVAAEIERRLGTQGADTRSAAGSPAARSA